MPARWRRSGAALRAVAGALAMAGLVGAGALVGPAAAIETAGFGLDVAQPTEDGRLHVPAAAGATSTGAIRVWNKTAAPLTLELRIASARVEADGRASPGGDDPAVGWVSVDPATVELGPSAEATVAVEVRPPRRLGGEAHTVAVVAHPVPASGGDQPAVIQRLALTVFLEPDGPSFVESLGPWPWVALVLLLAVAALAALTRARTTAS